MPSRRSPRCLERSNSEFVPPSTSSPLTLVRQDAWPWPGRLACTGCGSRLPHRVRSVRRSTCCPCSPRGSPSRRLPPLDTRAARRRRLRHESQAPCHSIPVRHLSSVPSLSKICPSATTPSADRVPNVCARQGACASPWARSCRDNRRRHRELGLSVSHRTRERARGLAVGRRRSERHWDFGSLSAARSNWEFCTSREP